MEAPSGERLRGKGRHGVLCRRYTSALLFYMIFCYIHPPLCVIFVLMIYIYRLRMLHFSMHSLCRCLYVWVHFCRNLICRYLQFLHTEHHYKYRPTADRIHSIGHGPQKHRIKGVKGSKDPLLLEYGSNPFHAHIDGCFSFNWDTQRKYRQFSASKWTRNASDLNRSILTRLTDVTHLLTIQWEWG